MPWSFKSFNTLNIECLLSGGHVPVVFPDAHALALGLFSSSSGALEVLLELTARVTAVTVLDVSVVALLRSGLDAVAAVGSVGSVHILAVKTSPAHVHPASMAQTLLHPYLHFSLPSSQASLPRT